MDLTVPMNRVQGVEAAQQSLIYFTEMTMATSQLECTDLREPGRKVPALIQVTSRVAPCA